MSPSQASSTSSKAPIHSLSQAVSKASGIGSVRRGRTAVGVTKEASAWRQLFNALSLPPQDRTDADIDRILETVQGNSFFDRYPKPKKRQLAAVSKAKEMAVRDVVFREGDEGDDFYVIIRGTVEVRVKSNEPPYLEVAVNVLKVGEYFGELALMENGGVRAATIVCKSACTFLTVERADFEACLNQWAHEEVLERLDLLRAVPVFAGLDDDYLQFLTFDFEAKTFQKADELMSFGKDCDKVYIIVSGRVTYEKRIDLVQDETNHLLSTTERPRRTHVLQVAAATEHELVGDLEFILNCDSLYRVVANSTVETLFINKLKLTEHCSLELFERLKTANALRSSWRNARILLWLKMIRKGTWVPEKERACIEPEISKAQTKQHIGLATGVPASLIRHRSSASMRELADPMMPVANDAAVPTFAEHNSNPLATVDTKFFLYFQSTWAEQRNEHNEPMPPPLLLPLPATASQKLAQRLEHEGVRSNTAGKQWSRQPIRLQQITTMPMDCRWPDDAINRAASAPPSLRLLPALSQSVSPAAVPLRLWKWR